MVNEISISKTIPYDMIFWWRCDIVVNNLFHVILAAAASQNIWSLELFMSIWFFASIYLYRVIHSDWYLKIEIYSLCMHESGHFVPIIDQQILELALFCDVYLLSDQIQLEEAFNEQILILYKVARLMCFIASLIVCDRLARFLNGFYETGEYRSMK